MCGHTGSIPATTESCVAMYKQMDRLIAAINAQKGLTKIIFQPDICQILRLISVHTVYIPMKTIIFKFVNRFQILFETFFLGAVIVTADHGNCEEMLDKKGKPMTSHTIKAVPFWIMDKNAKYIVDTTGIERPGLANVAATVCNMLGFQAPSQYHQSLIKFRDSEGAGYAKSSDNRYKPY